MAEQYRCATCKSPYTGNGLGVNKYCTTCCIYRDLELVPDAPAPTTITPENLVAIFDAGVASEKARAASVKPLFHDQELTWAQIGTRSAIVTFLKTCSVKDADAIYAMVDALKSRV